MMGGNTVDILMVIFTSTTLQIILDVFGHTTYIRNNRQIYRRNLLHSLPGVILLGTIGGTLTSLLLQKPIQPTKITKNPYITPLTLSTLTHWIEDLITEGGTYILTKRIKPHKQRIPYGSDTLNTSTILLFTTIHTLYIIGTLETQHTHLGLLTSYITVLTLTILNLTKQ
jgi:hypothetical protein